jgi:hypothetical protein
MVNISAETVFTILSNKLEQFTPNNTFSIMAIIADEGYVTVPPNWLRDTVLHEAILSPSKYRRDIFDCDDYVMFLKTKISLYAANKKEFNRPIAAGFLLTQIHAFNFGITDENKLFILNTQSADVDLIIDPLPGECAQFLDIAENNLIKFIYI